METAIYVLSAAIVINAIVNIIRSTMWLRYYKRRNNVTANTS